MRYCPKGTAHFLTSPKISDAKGIFVMIQFTPVGDSGVLAVCGSEISEQVNAQVMAQHHCFSVFYLDIQCLDTA